MKANGVDVLEELMAMFCLLDDKGVIDVSKPKPGWIGGSADGLRFKLFHVQIGNEGANGGTHGCAMDLLKILTNFLLW